VAPEPSLLESIVDTVTSPGKLAPIALRTASAFTGGGALGAIVGGLGEAGAEGVENLTGARSGFSPVEIGGQAAVGAIPFGKFAEGTSVLGRIVREAGRGTAAVSLDTLSREGRLPGEGELAVGAGLGALGGAVGSALHAGETVAPTVAADEAGNVGRSVLDDALRVLAPEKRTPGAEEAAGAIRKLTSYRDATSVQLEHTFGEAAAGFDKDAAADPTLRNSVVDAYETQGVAGVEKVAPQYAPVFEHIAKLQQEAHDSISALRGGDLGFRDFYLSRNFQYVGTSDAEEAAQKVLQGSRALGAEPGFAKERSFQFEADARAAGFEQVEQNPIKQAVNYLNSAKEYEQSLVTFRDLEEKGLITRAAPLRGAPESGLVPIQSRLVKMLDPESGNLQSVQYYASEPVARIFNNYLGQGLSQSPTYQALYTPATLINTFRVAVSAFHFTLESINSAAEGLGSGLLDIARGEVGGGLKQVAKSATVVPKLWEDYMRGRSVLKSIPALTHFQGGFSDLESDIGKIVNAGGRLGAGEDWRGFVNAAKTALADGSYGAAVGDAARGLSALTAQPLMGNFVPRVKLGSFLGLAERELDRLKPQTQEEAIKILQTVWDHTDDVFGQLVRDNLFFSRKMKDMLNLVIGFPGWNIGSARKIIAAGRGIGKAALGAPVDLEAQEATRYWLGLTAQVALMGSVLNYAWTGEWPSNVRDMFYPRTGNTRPNGSPERRQLPSYIKDVVGLATHPIATLSHKQNPLLGTLVELADNIDFYGNQIRDKSAPLDSQALDVAKHVGKAFVPFSVSGFLNSKGSTGERLTNFVGINPPPAAITNTDAQNLINEFTAERAPASRTKEQAAQAELHKRLVQEARDKDPALKDDIAGALQSGDLSRRQLQNIMTEARQDPFKSRFEKLDFDQALQVYRVANDDERQKARAALVRKFSSVVGPKRRDLRDELVKLGVFKSSAAATSFGLGAR
jgi:hypothetical protein